MRRPRLRIHQDIIVTSAMLVEPSDTVLLLPATTRYESPGGGTETSTERRIIFSPEIGGRRIGEARPEWQVFGDVVARARPAVAGSVRFESAQAIRREIAEAVPLYAGIEHLAARGDQVQWGGRLLYPDGRFDTASGRAAAVVVPMVSRAQGPGEFLVSTRRGKQFNSMVQHEVDPLTGASRDAVLMSAVDAEGLGVRDGDRSRWCRPMAASRATRTSRRSCRAISKCTGRKGWACWRPTCSMRSRASPTTTRSCAWSKAAGKALRDTSPR
jgi:predicted molibdopterin-dependent oxidoreductase YjgC